MTEVTKEQIYEQVEGSSHPSRPVPNTDDYEILPGKSDAEYTTLQHPRRVSRENSALPPVPVEKSDGTLQRRNGSQTVFERNLHPSTIAAAVSEEYKCYNGRLSVTFGVINMLLVTTSIILSFLKQNGASIWVENVWPGTFLFIMYPALFCGIFIFVAAGFSIASGKSKTRYLIITHLVLGIIGTAFCLTFLGFSIGSFVHELAEWNDSFYRGDKLSFAISVVWILFSSILSITSSWCVILCCKAICCGPPIIIQSVVATDGATEKEEFSVL